MTGSNKSSSVPVQRGNFNCMLNINLNCDYDFTHSMQFMVINYWIVLYYWLASVWYCNILLATKTCLSS